MSRRIALTLLLAASILPAQPIPPRPEQLTFKPLTFEAPRVKDFKATLKNGIPVYIAADPTGQPLVRINILVRGGSYLEPAGKEGLATLTGQLLRKGGTAKLTPEQLDERLEFLAAELNTSLGETSGSLSLETLEKDVPEGLDLLMQVLTQPAFAQERLDLVKKEARQSLDRRNDSVTSIARFHMPFLLNGENHFTARDMTLASLESITRDDLKAFHARLIHPSNLVVAVSGKVDQKAILARLNQTLGALKPAKDAVVSPKPPAPDFTRKPGVYLIDKDVPQSMVQFVIPGLRRTDPDWYAVTVMNQILGGGGFTSRLMKKIRSDEGLTYGIYTRFSEGPYWRGDMTCSFQTKNRSVAYALRLAQEIIENLKKHPVPEAELQVIKDGIIEAFPSQFSNRQAIAQLFAREALTGWPEDFYATYREKITAVTPAEVQRVAQKYLTPDQMVLLIVGKVDEVLPGDKDHPGTLQESVKLPLTRLPLRDPLTLKPRS